MLWVEEKNKCTEMKIGWVSYVVELAITLSLKYIVYGIIVRVPQSALCPKNALPSGWRTYIAVVAVI